MYHWEESSLSLLFYMVSVFRWCKHQQKITIVCHAFFSHDLQECYLCIIEFNSLTSNVPLTVCSLASLSLLHEKHVFSLHNLLGSWEPHLVSGGWIEFAVSPNNKFCKYDCKYMSNPNLYPHICYRRMIVMGK